MPLKKIISLKLNTFKWTNEAFIDSVAEANVVIANIY